LVTFLQVYTRAFEVADRLVTKQLTSYILENVDRIENPAASQKVRLMNAKILKNKFMTN